MASQMVFDGRGRRLALALATGLVALGLSLPAFAIDTGGAGDTTPAPPSAKPAMAKPAMAKPAVPLLKLDDARALIDKKDFAGAIKLLRQIVVQQPHNADAENLLGYSLRQTGQMAEAESWYLKALKLQPRHLGANEYLGELYVMTGQMAKAKARLAEIGKICGNTTCEEYQDLSKAITAKG